MLVLGLALSSTANAALIDYSFNGTAGAGSSIDLGAGAIDLSGVSLPPLAVLQTIPIYFQFLSLASLLLPPPTTLVQ